VHSHPRLPALLAHELHDLEPVRADRAEALGLAEHGEHEPRVVGLTVVEQIAARRVAPRQRRQQLDHLLAGDQPMALRAPIPVRVRPRLGRGATGATPPPQPRRRHHVVHVQADTGQPIRPIALERGHHQLQRANQVRSELDQQPALEQGLANESEVEVLEVAKAPVDQLARAAAGAGRVIGPLDQGDAVPAGGGVERNPRARDPSTDHHDVESLTGQRLDRALARDHRHRLRCERGRGSARGTTTGA